MFVTNDAPVLKAKSGVCALRQIASDHWPSHLSFRFEAPGDRKERDRCHNEDDVTHGSPQLNMSS